MLYMTQIKTGIESQLEWFLAGHNLPMEMGQIVVSELAPEIFFKESYKELIDRVKLRLNADSIIVRGGMLYVDYDAFVKTSKAELATLVRFINMRHDGHYTIVMNHEEVLYIPEDYKNNTSIHEMMAELSLVVSRDKSLNLKAKALRAKTVVFNKEDDDLNQALNDMSKTEA